MRAKEWDSHGGKKTCSLYSICETVFWYEGKGCGELEKKKLIRGDGCVQVDPCMCVSKSLGHL